MPLHRQLYCSNCGCERTFWKRTLRHQTNALLTAITLGVWGFVWLTKAIIHWRKPWKCRSCTRPHERHSSRQREVKATA